MKPVFFLALWMVPLTMVGQKFHTEYRYTDPINNGISIGNSYPKGGQKYSDPEGHEYVYAVFWTRITNRTASVLELTIDFPTDPFIIPSSPGNEFRLYSPDENMLPEKEPLFNYGLDLPSFLDANIDRPSARQIKISPEDSYLFYVVALSERGVDGVVRAGFELHDRDLIYRINGYEIKSGKLVAKK